MKNIILLLLLVSPLSSCVMTDMVFDGVDLIKREHEQDALQEAKSIKCEGFEISYEGKYFWDKRVWLTLEIKNLSERALDSFDMSITIKSSYGDTLLSQVVIIDQSIQPKSIRAIQLLFMSEKIFDRLSGWDVKDLTVDISIPKRVRARDNREP